MASETIKMIVADWLKQKKKLDAISIRCDKAADEGFCTWVILLNKHGLVYVCVWAEDLHVRLRCEVFPDYKVSGQQHFNKEIYNRPKPILFGNCWVEIERTHLCCAVIYLFYGSLLTRNQKNKGKDISLLHLSSCFSNKATVLKTTTHCCSSENCAADKQWKASLPMRWCHAPF